MQYDPESSYLLLAYEEPEGEVDFDEDEPDEHEGEPECGCYHFCAQCTGVRGWVF